MQSYIREIISWHVIALLEIIMKSHQSDFRNIFYTKRSDEVNIIWSDIYSRASSFISSTLCMLFSRLSKSLSLSLFHFHPLPQNFITIYNELNIGFYYGFAITYICVLCADSLLSSSPLDLKCVSQSDFRVPP